MQTEEYFGVENREFNKSLHPIPRPFFLSSSSVISPFSSLSPPRSVSSIDDGPEYDYDAADVALYRAHSPLMIHDLEIYSANRHSVLADIGLEVHQLKQALGLNKLSSIDFNRSQKPIEKMNITNTISNNKRINLEPVEGNLTIKAAKTINRSDITQSPLRTVRRAPFGVE